MTAPADPMLVMITRVEGKLDTLAERVQAQGQQHSMSDEQLQRAMDSLRELIREVREEARRETTGATSRLEAQIAAVAADLNVHVEAKNPHPVQEDWLRLNTREVATSVALLRSGMDADRGARRVLSFLAVTAVGIGASLLTKLLGG